MHFTGKNLTKEIQIHSMEPATCFNSDNNLSLPCLSRNLQAGLDAAISDVFPRPQQTLQHSVNLCFSKPRFEAFHIPELADDYFEFLRTLKPKTHFNFMSNFMRQSLGL